MKTQALCDYLYPEMAIKHSQFVRWVGGMGGGVSDNSPNLMSLLLFQNELSVCSILNWCKLCMFVV